MSPVVRIWAIAAAGAALLLALRGAWPLALLCLMLSPAPAWALARGPAERAQAATGWLRAIATTVVILVAGYLAVIAVGGIPPVHEWRGALASAAR